MIKFNFQKISQTPINFFKKRKEISEYLKRLKTIIKERNFNFPENFLILPEEKPTLPAFSENLKSIFLIGIGGSSQGAKAIFEALKAKKKLREIFFFDSLNPLFLKEIERKLKEAKRGEVFVCLISESGKTFETLANFFVVLKLLKKLQPKISVITLENSPLWDFAKKNNYLLLKIPKVVGRYSVFSNVGLFPLSLAGVNVKKLLFGAKKANEICLKDNPLKNPAFSSALIIFYHWKKGKNIYSNLVFPPNLEGFGKWYVQLMAESLGKEKKGITPIVNIGTTDFHAIGQLFFDGPRDKLVNFIFVENLDIDYQIPKDKDLKILFPTAPNKKIWKLNRAIFEGVKKAYFKKELAFTETLLERLDEENLGFLMEMKMIEIIFLAKLMGVDAFNQPGVELYKEETRKILKSL